MAHRNTVSKQRTMFIWRPIARLMDALHKSGRPFMVCRRLLRMLDTPYAFGARVETRPLDLRSDETCAGLLT